MESYRSELTSWFSIMILDKLLLNSVVCKKEIISIAADFCEDKRTVKLLMSEKNTLGNTGKNKNLVVWFCFVKIKHKWYRYSRMHWLPEIVWFHPQAFLFAEWVVQNEQNLEIDAGKEKLLKVGLEEEFGKELRWGDGKWLSSSSCYCEGLWPVVSSFFRICWKYTLI